MEGGGVVYKNQGVTEVGRDGFRFEVIVEGQGAESGRSDFDISIYPEAYWTPLLVRKLSLCLFMLQNVTVLTKLFRRNGCNYGNICGSRQTLMIQSLLTIHCSQNLELSLRRNQKCHKLNPVKKVFITPMMLNILAQKIASLKSVVWASKIQFYFAYSNLETDLIDLFPT